MDAVKQKLGEVNAQKPGKTGKDNLAGTGSGSSMVLLALLGAGAVVGRKKMLSA